MQAHQLRSEATEWNCRTLFAGKLHGRVEILEQGPHMPLDRLEAALSHLRGEDLQGFRVGEAAGQRLGDQAGVNPGLLGQGHDLGNHQRIAGDDHLVAGLGHLPRPYAAHVRDPLAQGQQYGTHPFEVSGIATHHDRQSARFGTRGSA